MKSILPLIIALTCLPLSVICANEDFPEPLSEAEAAKIVAAEEQAKEAAKDAREVELNSAEITRTVKLKQGDKTIIFNLVKPSKLNSTDTYATSGGGETFKTVASPERCFFVDTDRPLVNLTLHGDVDEDGISELWWNYEGQRHHIFSNANFLLLSGIGSFSNETNRYSVFSLVTRGGHKESDPSPSDFTEGQLEYLIVEGSADPAAYRGIECMMQHYAEHYEQLKIKYENDRKLREAREAYLEANPPKKRDIILNYSK